MESCRPARHWYDANQAQEERRTISHCLVRLDGISCASQEAAFQSQRLVYEQRTQLQRWASCVRMQKYYWLWVSRSIHQQQWQHRAIVLLIRAERHLSLIHI